MLELGSLPLEAWQELNVCLAFQEHSIIQSTKFQIPSVDPEKRYTFYVKSKRYMLCATTDLWSEESEPAFWGKGERGGQEGLSTSKSQERGTGRAPILLCSWAPLLPLEVAVGNLLPVYRHLLQLDVAAGRGLPNSQQLSPAHNSQLH